MIEGTVKGGSGQSQFALTSSYTARQVRDGEVGELDSDMRIDHGRVMTGVKV